MKRTALQLSINNPCHENWETMTTNAQGKFCAKPSCKTTAFYITTCLMLVSNSIIAQIRVKKVVAELIPIKQITKPISNDTFSTTITKYSRKVNCCSISEEWENPFSRDALSINQKGITNTSFDLKHNGQDILNWNRYNKALNYSQFRPVFER